MAARCGSCGNTVLTYWQFSTVGFRQKTSLDKVKLWWSSPHVKCAHCGAEVRQRHYRARTYGSMTFVILSFVAVTLLTDSLKLREAACVGLLVVVAVANYWAWRALPWDPVQPGAAAPPAPPPAG